MNVTIILLQTSSQVWGNLFFRLSLTETIIQCLDKLREGQNQDELNKMHDKPVQTYVPLSLSHPYFV